MNRKSFVVGIIAGLAAPLIAFGIMYLLFAISDNRFSPKFIGILCVLANLPFFNLAYRRKLDYTAKGILFITLLLAIAYIYFFYIESPGEYAIPFFKSIFKK